MTSPTYTELAEILDRHRASDERAQAEALAAAARYAVLSTFDGIRRSLGHDYGNGQRAGELARLERDLPTKLLTAALEVEFPGSAAEHGLELEPLDPELVARTFAAVARMRLRRLELEAYRSRTASTLRTVEAWHRTARRLNLPIPFTTGTA